MGEWLLYAVMISGAAMVFVPIFCEQVTRAVVRAWLEEQAAVRRRLFEDHYQESDDGE